MLTTLLFTVIILLICMALLSIKVLLKKNGTFPSTHVGSNKALGKKGIYCAKTQHVEALKHRDLAKRMEEITNKDYKD